MAKPRNTKPSTSSRSLSSPEQNPLITLCNEYQTKTPLKLKIIDGFLVYCVLTGVIQMLYVVLVGSYPKNSFLSGFIMSVAMFVLGAALRKQINRDERKDFPDILPERAYVDFVVAGILVLLVGVNYMG